MEEFFMLDKAEEGIDLPLYLPGSAVKTEHSIRIRGTDSETFRVAEVAGQRALRKVVNSENLADADRLHIEEKRRLVASLVISWTFDQPCTMENVIEFLRKAPQIEDMISEVSAKRRLFFNNGSNSSASTPEPNSN